jgi:hypothetical protein
MNDLPEAFYLPAGDAAYEPTRATESPWDGDAQHGGPPAALLADAIDATIGPGMRLARISVDFLGPIPRRPLQVEVTARAWHIATGPTPPAESEHLPPPALPPAGADRPLAGLTGWGYGEAVEWRFTHGGHGVLGPARVWTRVRLPLIAGRKLTGLARTLIVADSANGLSAALPFARWLSIPPTMTTTLLRVPDDDWVYLDCRTHLADDGIGLAHATVSDPGGYLGEVAQPLLVRER